MAHGKNKKNFELLQAEEFVVRVTQHVPEKGFQMVRYYGTQTGPIGRRRNEKLLRPGDTPPEKKDSIDFTILDVSDYDLLPVCVRTRTGRRLAWIR